MPILGVSVGRTGLHGRIHQSPVERPSPRAPQHGLKDFHRFVLIERRAAYVKLYRRIGPALGPLADVELVVVRQVLDRPPRQSARTLHSLDVTPLKLGPSFPREPILSFL